MSFGKKISDQRKKLGYSQKGMAQRIKKEDETPITAQYLNDIEHGRRNPPPEYILRQLAKILEIEFDILSYWAGKLPETRNLNLSDEEILDGMKLFRKSPKENNETDL